MSLLHPSDILPLLAGGDFAAAEAKLRQTFGQWLSEKDVMSHAMYPKVFNEWKKYELIYGEVRDCP